MDSKVPVVCPRLPASASMATFLSFPLLEMATTMPIKKPEPSRPALLLPSEVEHLGANVQGSGRALLRAWAGDLWWRSCSEHPGNLYEGTERRSGRNWDHGELGRIA